MSAFTITASQTDPGLYQLSGQLGYDNAKAVALEGEKLMATSQQAITLDFAAVERVDTAGIAVILSWTRLAQEKQQSFAIRGLPAQALALIENSGLSRLLPVT
ncbi:STAS domain-containing protein [Leucothrix pacifica]|uniref:STAS domain-containing protein n=1 Tax=Leucothrix pacifica TaxID=1247513 RepID=A0A317CVM8_9GAMM|nr:STAS domain-containing protein [Leucothrix pacifica]PWR00403.1 hypothetical protein DKW60_02295 [Leucothrix pacifica]